MKKKNYIPPRMFVLFINDEPLLKFSTGTPDTINSGGLDVDGNNDKSEEGSPADAKLGFIWGNDDV
jgi:hypothetical protein